MTDRLYYSDSYLAEFEARVLQGEQVGKLFEVRLDRTAFYPTSGGQPHDLGSIEGHPVVEVDDGPGGTIIHRLEHRPGPTRVRCQVHWPRRFDHMQQHTGQHILSQSFIRVASLATVGFHLSAGYSTIDLEAADVDPNALRSAEDLANSIVYQNRSVTSELVPPDEAARLNLRKPSQREGILRVVSIRDFDVSACGGTHVRQTGEIGGIFINGVERVNRRTRVEFVCGGRSLHSYRRCSEDLDRIAKGLSVAPQDAPDRVEKQTREMKNIRKRLKAKDEWLAELLAQDLFYQSPSQEGIRIVQHQFEGEERTFLTLLAQRLLACGPCWVLLGNGGEQAQLLLARSQSLPGDLRPVMKECSLIISGRGGGSPALVQGGGSDSSQLRNALDCAARRVLALANG
ncbi:MAG: DHHA1 domain-containing protein [Acidobacteriota bacterium]|nr:DHHA1 domain-containing protein [Acidobacteriota bacterium]